MRYVYGILRYIFKLVYNCKHVYLASQALVRVNNNNTMAHSIEEQLQQEHPQARVTVLHSDESGPYKVYEVMIRKRVFAYNDKYPEDNRCLCGHAYYRHFDPYEEWAAVGCKYCGCGHFIHEVGAERLSPFDRMQRFGRWDVRLEDYLEQWELFAYAFYPDIEEYLGASVKQWMDIIEPPDQGEGNAFRSSHPSGTFDAEDFVEVDD